MVGEPVFFVLVDLVLVPVLDVCHVVSREVESWRVMPR